MGKMSKITPKGKNGLLIIFNESIILIMKIMVELLIDLINLNSNNQNYLINKTKTNNKNTKKIGGPLQNRGCRKKESKPESKCMGFSCQSPMMNKFFQPGGAVEKNGMREFYIGLVV